MGSFYTNIALRGALQDRVMQFLKQQKSHAYVSPTLDNVTVVYDEQSDTQDTDVLESLAARLSAAFGCVTLAVLNHDDEVLLYWLYERGQLVDEYNSNPGYFDGGPSEPSGGDASKLCQAMGSQNVERVRTILHKTSGGTAIDPTDFIDPAAFLDRDLMEKSIRALMSKAIASAGAHVSATERHTDLARALNLPSITVNWGFHYIETNNVPDDLDISLLKRTW